MTPRKDPIPLKAATDRYNTVVAESRSPNTARAYAQATAKFLELLADRNVNPDTAPMESANESWLIDFIGSLRDHSPATERLYLTAVVGFYEFLASEYGLDVNLARVRALVRRRQRRVPPKLPEFPRRDVESVITCVEAAASDPCKDDREKLRNLRDKAFILTLADTGLRIGEACSLTRGQYDRDERQAIVVIKGGAESIVRFSERAHKAILAYLEARSRLDGASGRAMSALPVFARHDRGAGAKLKQIKTVGARNIINKWVVRALGSASRGLITPHTFRHYFVTVVLRGSGGNLKLAQELARHKNIAITQRYAHLADDDLDRGYHEIFND